MVKKISSGKTNNITLVSNILVPYKTDRPLVLRRKKIGPFPPILNPLIDYTMNVQNKYKVAIPQEQRLNLSK